MVEGSSLLLSQGRLVDEEGFDFSHFHGKKPTLQYGNVQIECEQESYCPTIYAASEPSDEEEDEDEATAANEAADANEVITDEDKDEKEAITAAGNDDDDGDNDDDSDDGSSSSSDSDDSIFERPFLKPKQHNIKGDQDACASEPAEDEDKNSSSVNKSDGTSSNKEQENLCVRMSQTCRKRRL